MNLYQKIWIEKFHALTREDWIRNSYDKISIKQIATLANVSTSCVLMQRTKLGFAPILKQVLTPEISREEWIRENLDALSYDDIAKKYNIPRHVAIQIRKKLFKTKKPLRPLSHLKSEQKTKMWEEQRSATMAARKELAKKSLCTETFNFLAKQKRATKLAWEKKGTENGKKLEK